MARKDDSLPAEAGHYPDVSVKLRYATCKAVRRIVKSRNTK